MRKVTRLGDFILQHIEEILGNWEQFASTINPDAVTIDLSSTHGHPRQMLEVIALDLSHQQSKKEQFAKSVGKGPSHTGDTAAETHAAARLRAGFSVQELISEYRALRASILNLWATESKDGVETDPDDVTRFNEAIDQALAESVGRYAKLVDRSQNLFLAILGHDLRNPLATTMLASNYIIQTGNNGPTTSAASRIHNAGKRMNRLINDLLDYTRTNLGITLPIIHKATDLSALCADSIAEHAMAHPEVDFQLVAEPAIKGRWDDNRIAQALSNLLGNAVQYGEKNAPIVLQLHQTDDDVFIRLRNRGPVIPTENLAGLFEPLVRFSNPSSEEELHSKNLGIGLYIAREIINAHGGSIEVTSDELDGTEFKITLPREPSATVRQMYVGNFG